MRSAASSCCVLCRDPDSTAFAPDARNRRPACAESHLVALLPLDWCVEVTKDRPFVLWIENLLATAVRACTEAIREKREADLGCTQPYLDGF